MKRKPKVKTERGEASVASIARLSGLSISRIYRLLAEGRTGGEIVATAQRRKEESALRSVPAVPVTNGHAAADGMVTFSASQAQKEMWSARLKELEFMERSGTLVPVSYIKFWGGNFIVGIKDEMQKMGELRDTLAAESDPVRVQEILDRWVSRVFDKLYRLESLWTPTPPGTM